VPIIIELEWNCASPTLIVMNDLNRFQAGLLDCSFRFKGIEFEDEHDHE
jgi:hypothetical protein